MPNICKAVRPVEFDQDTLNQVQQPSTSMIHVAQADTLCQMQHACLQVVAEHLFHEGKFAVGDAFIQEAGIAKGASLKKPFEAMHQVLKEVCSPLPLHS